MEKNVIKQIHQQYHECKHTRRSLLQNTRSRTQWWSLFLVLLVCYPCSKWVVSLHDLFSSIFIFEAMQVTWLETQHAYFKTMLPFAKIIMWPKLAQRFLKFLIPGIGRRKLIVKELTQLKTSASFFTLFELSEQPWSLHKEKRTNRFHIKFWGSVMSVNTTIWHNL